LANGKTKLILAQRLPQFHRAKVELEQNAIVRPALPHPLVD